MTEQMRNHFYWAFENCGNISHWKMSSVDLMFEHLNTPNGLNMATFEKLVPETRAGVTRLLDRMCERFPMMVEKLSDNRPKIYRLKLQVETFADREMGEKLTRLNQLEKFYAEFGINGQLMDQLGDLVLADDATKAYRLKRGYQFSQTVVTALNKYVVNRKHTKLAIFMHENILKHPDLVIDKLCELANRDEDWGTNPENMVDF